ncbi:MAG: hypothetical protein KF878_26045 [Planctomycetes bacterium]|nr:hypothetical protein [Planctomycetota bacterium]
MDPMRLLEKTTKRFTLDHLRKDEVEAVSVLALDELDALITAQVTERTGQLAAELKHVRKRLQELEAEQSQAGGLERAAADAALEAEARALEAKASAELRADQAEARVRELERQLADGAGAAPAPAAEAAPAQDDGKLAALEEQVRALEERAARAEQRAADAEGRVADAEGRAGAAEARVAGLEADLKKAREAGGGDGEPAEPVTPDDHKRARRLVDALLDDIVNEDEARAKAALKSKAFRVNFAGELETARRQYVKRVKAAVRGDQDHWNEAIDALEAKAQKA